MENIVPSGDQTATAFAAPPPARAFHGTTDHSALIQGLPSAATCRWYTRVSWREHDRWMDGGALPEDGIPYANILWEALGLRDRRRHPEGVRPWARRIRTHEDLASSVAMIFVTDREDDARRYGSSFEVDLSSTRILDVVGDPHVRTHNGWIVLLSPGDPVPIVAS